MAEIAIIGAGIIGITNAVHLLENGFKVTVFTKDSPLQTNSDAAAATWYLTGDRHPILQKLCLASLPKLEALSQVTYSGVQRIPMVYYFKNKEDFTQSAWAQESLRTFINLTYQLPTHHITNQDFPMAVFAKIPLIDCNIYRPFMLQKFNELGGILTIKMIHSLATLSDSYDIVINCAGWEAKYLTDDESVYPVRGQVEVAKVDADFIGKHSVNITDLDAYAVLRPQSNDCMMGTTIQENNTGKEIRMVDRNAIISKITPFFPSAPSFQVVSKTGLRCWRPDVRIESEYMTNSRGKQVLLVHCYGHRGSGYSAAWASADKVLAYCLDFSRDHSHSND